MRIYKLDCIEFSFICAKCEIKQEYLTIEGSIYKGFIDVGTKTKKSLIVIWLSIVGNKDTKIGAYKGVRNG